MGKAYDWEMEKFRVIIDIYASCKKNSLIKVTREDFSKTSSDLLKIHSDTSIGRHSKLDNQRDVSLQQCLVLDLLEHFISIKWSQVFIFNIRLNLKERTLSLDCRKEFRR